MTESYTQQFIIMIEIDHLGLSYIIRATIYVRSNPFRPRGGGVVKHPPQGIQVLAMDEQELSPW